MGGTEARTSRADVGGVSLTEGPLEREAELARLAGLARRAAGGDGCLVLIEGPAGIGKTTLLREARALAEPAGMTVLTARGSELEREFSFGVVRQLFEPTLTTLTAGEREEVMAGAAGLAEAVLAEVGSKRSAEPAGDTRQAALHGLYWLCANLAERGPLVLAVDDAHWADRPSLTFLEYLARRLEGLPALVALAARTGEPAADAEALRALADAGEGALLRPGALSPEAVGSLAREALGLKIGDEVSPACHEASGGNPFLLAELLDELAERVALGLELSPGAIPGIEARGIAAAVAGRIARIGGAAPGVARALAVLGDGAELRQVADLAGLDLEDAGRAADALAAAAILAPGRPPRFLHPLLRTAVYGEVGHGERASAHARAARLLGESGGAPEAVASHLLLAEPVGDPWVTDVLSQAARTGLARGTPEVAVHYLERALEEGEPGRHLLGELGLAEVQAGRFEPGVEHLRRAIELNDVPAERAELTRVMAQTIAVSDSVADGVRVLRGELDAQPGAPPDVRHRLQAEYASMTLFAIDGAATDLAAFDEMLEHEAREVSLDGPAARILLSAYGYRLVMSGRSDAQVGAAAIVQALDAGLRDEAMPPSLPSAATAHGLICAEVFGAARELCERDLERARAAGSAIGASQAANLLAILNYRVGLVARAETLASEGLELSRAAGSPIGTVACLAILVECLTERGRTGDAWAELSHDGFDEALPAVSFATGMLAESRGHLRALDGDHRGALTDLLEAGELHRRAGMTGPGATAWRSGAALANHALGEGEKAHRLAAEELELARRFDAPRAIGIALRSLGLVEGGERGLELLREAASVLGDSEARLEHARSLVDLGAALRRAGSRTEARERLAAGMDLAHRCGAGALAERAREELVAAGARPRRLAISGLEGLTARERRVAELAAEGLANKEIAQALFVTVRTVEMHLSNAYRKLGISSREGLPAELMGTADRTA